MMISTWRKGDGVAASEQSGGGTPEVVVPSMSERAGFFVFGRIPVAYRTWAEDQFEPLKYLRNQLVESLAIVGFFGLVSLLDSSAPFSWWWVSVFLPFSLLMGFVVRPLRRRRLRKTWDKEQSARRLQPE